jgi:micrococcal nuclease
MMIGALLLLYGVITTAPVLPVFKLPATATAYTETALDKKKLFKVIKVVDGDTVEASIRGKTEPIRLLGIDTPETVDPRRPVQCFGKAASDKMKSLVSEQFVKLVDDRTQGNRDKYKRLLRYVYLQNGTFVNAEMIKQGYAFSYRQYPTKYLEQFNKLERQTREQGIGLWSACPINTTNTTKKVTTAPIQTVVTVPPAQNTQQNIQEAQKAPVQSGSSDTGGDKDCKDFATHSEAQAYFTSKGGSPTNNVDRLDRDNDGIACEALP